MGIRFSNSYQIFSYIIGLYLEWNIFKGEGNDAGKQMYNNSR